MLWQAAAAPVAERTQDRQQGCLQLQTRHHRLCVPDSAFECSPTYLVVKHTRPCCAGHWGLSSGHDAGGLFKRLRHRGVGCGGVKQRRADCKLLHSLCCVLPVFKRQGRRHIVELLLFLRAVEGSCEGWLRGGSGRTAAAYVSSTRAHTRTHSLHALASCAVLLFTCSIHSIPTACMDNKRAHFWLCACAAVVITT